MNWKLYADEKPKAEPKREILVQFDNGHNMVCYSTEGSYPRTLIKWAEIEGPGEEEMDDTHKLVFKIVRQLADDIRNREKPKDDQHSWQQASAGRYQREVSGTWSDPPPPDPFEEWLEPLKTGLCYHDPFKPYEERIKAAAQAGWDAGVKWKAGFKP